MDIWAVLQPIITVQPQGPVTHDVLIDWVPSQSTHRVLPVPVCATDLQSYNVSRHGYMDPTTTYHHCRTDLQLYNYWHKHNFSNW